MSTCRFVNAPGPSVRSKVIVHVSEDVVRSEKFQCDNAMEVKLTVLNDKRGPNIIVRFFIVDGIGTHGMELTIICTSMPWGDGITVHYCIIIRQFFHSQLAVFSIRVAKPVSITVSIVLVQISNSTAGALRCCGCASRLGPLHRRGYSALFVVPPQRTLQSAACPAVAGQAPLARHWQYQRNRNDECIRPEVLHHPQVLYQGSDN